MLISIIIGNGASMKKITVNGPAKLSGEVTVSGSKNAALPIIFATLITEGISELRRLPDIGDVRVALDIIRSFGAEVLSMDGVTYIDTRRLSYCQPSEEQTAKIRASTYLLGACLSRFGRCRLSSFGGCNFALRPIDMHIDACLALGAEMREGEIFAQRLLGSEITFKKQSVGATVNAILLAVSAEGESVIRGFATEPHIDALIDFLLSAGASIERTEDEMRIVGRRLHGGKATVIGDMIEAGTYLSVALATGGKVRVRDCPFVDMSSFFKTLTAFGAENRMSGNVFSTSLRGRGEYISVTALPYPGFPTDLQPIIAPLMAIGSGGDITDTVWHTRFGYLDTLSDFGIRSELSGNRARIYPSKISPAKVTAPDLRGGAACLISALAAEGQSEIYSAEIILRGYENLTEKLRALGADINIQEF
ncbi:MAG: UDP-N-acetylglucosamine 1-carboxyvinyltransferase [Ruminococcaceae bacterium]|nr:UDP-N-acetylglucosamine 1-carboxyvinyltransferase [Oscillospiraceae bacterium]